jgi:hypothetical protein
VQANRTMVQLAIWQTSSITVPFVEVMWKWMRGNNDLWIKKDVAGSDRSTSEGVIIHITSGGKETHDTLSTANHGALHKTRNQSNRQLER